MINLHGDIPLEHRQLANSLIEMEQYFDEIPAGSPTAATAAQAYVAMAYDWIQMDLEEHAEALFHKAEKVYPGYFDKKIWSHMEESADFAHLVSNIKGYLATAFINMLGQKILATSKGVK